MGLQDLVGKLSHSSVWAGQPLILSECNIAHAIDFIHILSCAVMWCRRKSFGWRSKTSHSISDSFPNQLWLSTCRLIFWSKAWIRSSKAELHKDLKGLGYCTVDVWNHRINKNALLGHPFCSNVFARLNGSTLQFPEFLHRYIHHAWHKEDTLAPLIVDKISLVFSTT